MRNPADQTEGRTFGRRKTSLAGEIRPDGRPPVACRVLNLSAGGALLSPSSPAELPESFALKIETMPMELYCVIRRRDGFAYGVEFVDRTASKPVETDAVRALEDFARSMPWGRLLDD